MSSEQNFDPKGQEGTDEQRTGKHREEIDYEALAREKAGQTMYNLVEEIDKHWWGLIHTLEDGEQVDYQDLQRARSRMGELDRMFSEFLYQVGDISDVQARENGLYLEPDHSEWVEVHNKRVGADDGDE
jgi:hypothetical protein